MGVLFRLPVVTWDKDRVIAADSPTATLPICIWTQITVNLQDHSIMATDTRKLGKGHEGVNNACLSLPLAQTYHLVNTMQELMRRQMKAAQKEKK
jgi:signal transduction protein with GAF and PtsI domain